MQIRIRHSELALTQSVQHSTAVYVAVVTGSINESGVVVQIRGRELF